MVASSRRAAASCFARSFQSPSLRGSGRFDQWRTNGHQTSRYFNPLHCGAVVASFAQYLDEPSGWVSIPFIAGQWSLPSPDVPWVYFLEVFQSPSLRGSGRFLDREDGQSDWNIVSIPFIAGQWSLHQLEALARLRSDAGFNPLHCGAVVASFIRADRRNAA